MSPASSSGKITPKGRALFILGILIVALAGLSLRLYQLDQRPMHGDEANQAFKTGILLEQGEYIYDPHDHHGPTLYYAAALSAWLRGETSFAETNETTYRIVPVIFGFATILLLLLIIRPLGSAATFAAAIFLALSPAFVYYHRYFIQESMLVFFTFLAIAAGWRYFRKPNLGWALTAGAALGLMHATKETCVLAYAAMAAALAATLAWEKLILHRDLHWRPYAKPRPIAAAVVLGAALSIILFSAFFTHWRGVLDSILTYGNYIVRAEGAGMHDKPFYYYLSLLAYAKRGLGAPWSESLILLFAVIGIIAAFFRKTGTERHWPFIRFIALYTILLTLAYSIIPYKTPWSMLSFYLGFVLMAGVGVAEALRMPRRQWTRGLLAAAVALAMAQLYTQARRAIYEEPADPRNPYVYAHTSTAMLRLADRLTTLNQLNPGQELTVAVIEPQSDYWPIPWYARTLDRIGYYETIPDELDADLYIVPTSLAQQLKDRLGDAYITETHSLRPGKLLVAFIQKPLWTQFMQHTAQPPTPD